MRVYSTCASAQQLQHHWHIVQRAFTEFRNQRELHPMLACKDRRNGQLRSNTCAYHYRQLSNFRSHYFILSKLTLKVHHIKDRHSPVSATGGPGRTNGRRSSLSPKSASAVRSPVRSSHPQSVRSPTPKSDSEVRLRSPTPKSDSEVRLRSPTPKSDSEVRLRSQTPKYDSEVRLRSPTPSETDRVLKARLEQFGVLGLGLQNTVFTFSNFIHVCRRTSMYVDVDVLSMYVDVSRMYVGVC